MVPREATDQSPGRVWRSASCLRYDEHTARFVTGCMFFCLLLLAGGALEAHSPAQTRPPAQRKKSWTDEQADRLGAIAGVDWPRPAECGTHCANVLSQVADGLSERGRVLFSRSCQDACEKDAQAAVRPRPPSSVDPVVAWSLRELRTAVMQPAAFCVSKLGDRSPEGAALVAAVGAVKKSPEAVAAEAAQREAEQANLQYARSEPGRRVQAARDEAKRIGVAEGRRTEAVRAAERAADEASAAGDTTSLGKLRRDAQQRADEAFAKANRSARMAEAVLAYQAYNKAWRARVQAAPPDEQRRLMEELLHCMAIWADQ